MKKLIPLLLLISFLLHGVSNGQTPRKAKFWFHYQTDFGFGGSNTLCGTEPHYQLYLFFLSHNFYIYNYGSNDLDGKLNHNETKNDSVAFFYDDPPSSYYHSFGLKKNVADAGCTSGTCNTTNTEPILFNNCSTSDLSWKDLSCSIKGQTGIAHISWSITPAALDSLLVPPTDNSLYIDTKTQFDAPIGFQSYFYRWEYKIGTGSWLPFPSTFQSKSSISVSATDILGSANVINYVNQNIFIRINPIYCSTRPGNTLTYVIKKSPPNISSTTVTPPKCFDSNDGRVSFKFDRALVSGESLILNLVNLDNGKTISSPQINSLDINNSYTFTNALSPANYQFVYQNQFGTTQSNKITSNFTVTAPTVVSFTATKGNDVYCNGGSDGTINLTATGGAGSYHYTITPATTSGSTGGGFNTDNTQTITNLSAGTYFIQVYDDNGCYAKDKNDITITDTIKITQPDLLQISLPEKKDPLKYTGTDGYIIVNVNGGTTNTNGDAYNIAVKLASGTKFTGIITPLANSNPYQVTLGNLSAGIYTITATDKNGCTSTINDTLTQPPPLKLSVEVQDSIKCFGGIGSFIIHGSGGKRFSGNSPYIYSWKLQNSPYNPIIQTDSTVTGLSAGTYVLNIKDANGIALAPDSLFILGQPQLVEVQDSSHVDASCYGGYGSITTTIKGGTGNFYYKIGGINGGNSWKPFPNNSKKIVIDTLAGIYYIDIKDANNCQLSSVLSFTIHSPSSALTIKKIIVTNPSGFGLSNGSITANITGGTPLTTGYYNVTVTNKTGNIIPNNNIKVISTNIDTVYQVTVNNLPNGTYILTASDQNYATAVAGNNGGCIAISAPVKLTQPPPLVAKIEAKSEVLCSGDATGTLVVYGTGGVRYPSGRAPYNYTWSQQDLNGSFQILNGKTDSLLTGLTAGTYSVNIQDLNGNVLAKDSLFTLNQPLPVHIDMAHTNVYCFGGADGTITLNASGGVGNYQYMIKLASSPDAAWIPFGSNGVQEINNLLAGNYQVSIRDGNQCLPKDANGAVITNFPITITQPVAPLLASLVNQTNPSAHGASDGSITLLINGGTPKPGGTYNYSWTLLDGTPVTNNATAGVVSNGYQLGLTNIPDGTYVVTITDGNSSNAINNAGCIYVDTFKVVAPPPLMAKLSIKDGIFCNGDNGAILLANVTGGVPYKTGKPYNYVWKVKNNTGSYTILSTQTDSTATKLIAGYYALNVTDSKGVTLTQDSTIYISQPPLLEVSVTGRALTCSGVADANAVAVVTGGKPPYTYSWNTGDNTPTLSNLNAGTYLVVVKDANGCLAQQNIVITPPDAISIAVAKTNPSCNNSSNGQIIITPTGGNQPYTYKWLNSTNTNNFATNLAGGYYTVLVTDANGCSLTHTDTLKNPSILPLSIKPNRFICPNQSLMYDISINNPDITYQWTSDNGFSSSQPQVSLTQPGTYYAMVINKNGCFTKDTLVLTSGSGTISNDFLVPTQAFNNEPIVVVNTTNPAPDSVRWVLPSAAVISQQSTESVTFTIANPGSYDIKLITFSGQCSAEQTQKIFVSKPADLNSTGSTANPFITSFIVSPNPNSGTFRVQVKLQTQANIQLSLLNIATNTIQTIGKYTGTADYDIPLSYALGSGVYVLLLETPNGSRTFKIIVL